MSQADNASLDVVPACRHADGTISSSGVPDVWRMASEDSDEFVSGLPVVHRLDGLRDLDQPFTGQMSTGFDHIHASRELLEVVSLRRSQRMLAEEGNDRFEEIFPPSDHVLPEVLLVIVMTLVLEDPSHAEELSQFLEAVGTSRSLRHNESVEDLVTDSISDSTGPMRLPDKADGEASLSVYETDHPATELDQPFLLVFRTRHVVTMVNVHSDVTR
jgi:hypothetical protein